MVSERDLSRIAAFVDPEEDGHQSAVGPCDRRRAPEASDP
jgi:hypothetical protein